MREIEGLVDQMSEEERRRYLIESLFSNSVTYENEMLDAYMRRLTAPKKKGAEGPMICHSSPAMSDAGKSIKPNVAL